MPCKVSLPARVPVEINENSPAEGTTTYLNQQPVTLIDSGNRKQKILLLLTLQEITFF